MAYSKKSTARGRKPVSRGRSPGVRARKPARRSSASRSSAGGARTVKIVIEHVQAAPAMASAMPFGIDAPQTGPRKGQF